MDIHDNDAAAEKQKAAFTSSSETLQTLHEPHLAALLLRKNCVF